MELCRTATKDWRFWTVGVALLAALFLSLISYLELCSEECKAGLDWKLFGFSFAPIGILFFSALFLMHVLSIKRAWLGPLVGYALVGALGAEAVLIYIQKYKIGHWCPVCLAIAALVGAACLINLISSIQNLKNVRREHKQKGELMGYLRKGLTSLMVFGVGFFTLFLGIAEENPLDAMETTVKDKIAFGDANSQVSIYLFTDWACPACRALEPRLKSLMPTLTSKAKLTFVDLPVHPATLNYSPYNLAFMANNKDKYLELRNALTQLAQTTGTPTEAQIEKLAEEQRTKLIELNYADVSLGLKYWEELADKYQVDATPTMVIVTPADKKGIKLSGSQEITEANILKAINKTK